MLSRVKPHRDRGDRREMSPRAVAADPDPLGIGTDFRGVLGEPPGGGDRVFRARGIRMLRGQSVVHRRHHGIELDREAAGRRIRGVEVTEHPAASVKEDEERSGLIGDGVVHPHREGPRRARDGAIGDRGDLDRRIRRGQRGCRPRSCFLRGHRDDAGL
jgi:hypothetical protein